MKKEYVTAQNQHTLGFGEQVLHVKRLWVIVIAITLYLITGSFLYSSLAFLLLLFFSVKMGVLDVKQKEGLLHYLFAYYAAKFSSRLLENLSKVIRRFMQMCLLTTVAFAQIEPPPKDTLPPPPPPPAETPAENQNIVAQPMRIEEVEALLRRENIKTFVLEGQYHLAPGGHSKMPLRENNIVYFHETMPVLILFDKKIKDVFILSSISAFYDEKSVFLLGSSQVYAGFAVSFEDETYAYFTMIKQTDFSLSNFRREDKNLDKYLQEGKNYPLPPVRKLVTFYYFYTPKLVPLHKVVQAYLKSRRTCPEEGYFTYEGILYKVIKIGNTGVLKDDGDFFACGYYWRISR